MGFTLILHFVHATLVILHFGFAVVGMGMCLLTWPGLYMPAFLPPAPFLPFFPPLLPLPHPHPSPPHLWQAGTGTGRLDGTSSLPHGSIFLSRTDLLCLPVSLSSLDRILPHPTDSLPVDLLHLPPLPASPMVGIAYLTSSKHPTCCGMAPLPFALPLDYGMYMCAWPTHMPVLDYSPHYIPIFPGHELPPGMACNLMDGSAGFGLWLFCHKRVLFFYY